MHNMRKHLYRYFSVCFSHLPSPSRSATPQLFVAALPIASPSAPASTASRPSCHHAHSQRVDKCINRKSICGKGKAINARLDATQNAKRFAIMSLMACNGYGIQSELFGASKLLFVTFPRELSRH